MFSLSSQSPEFLQEIRQAQGATPHPPDMLSVQMPDGSAAGIRHPLLYIEDNPVNQLLIEELVALRPGWQLSLAADGREGLKLAQALRPALILLDLELPDMNGFEVLQTLRAEARTAGIPCIALSANALPEDVQRARAAGFTDYWTKPVDFKAFHAGLDHFLAQLNRELKPAEDRGS